ncbi:MerR family transcriptional regulator [Streptomonospora wellingtoniae]|uniref:MerR family transcriptional regulator n=1 Tax=Streptomonospora wellingtoniae TaxID=3075544 RepID=A0ABU2KZS0_9ACTN|nr:MerR family transcriptional regulator [Streptomonospora sp. DSM 45055]MDT0304752.1 MerR family transcriptional regulator [Streptomonospora sp. DSM 45055]
MKSSSPAQEGPASFEASRSGIGELAARFGLATHVLRHWEAAGLLTPERRANGRRCYTAGDATRVAIILRCKEAGLGLEQIRTLLNAPGPVKRNAVMKARVAELESRIAKAEAAKYLLECALTCTAEDIASCPHYQRIMAANVPEKRHEDG